MADPNKLLLPCPFCGGKAEWASTRKPYLIHCANPDCLGHHYEQDEQGGYNHGFYVKAEAVAAWNTRASMSRHPEQDAGDFAGWQIEGSIYDQFEAAISDGKRTIAHFRKYQDAVALMARLTTPPSQGA